MAKNIFANKDGSESEGSALDYDSDAFETASDSSDADDDESRDSYDFRFEDLEDLSFETIFMPLKQRREVLLAKRMGEKKTKVKKAVKLWNDTRRKTILRKVSYLYSLQLLRPYLLQNLAIKLR